MSDGKPGRPPRSGTVIRVRISEHVLRNYFPALKRRYPKLDRAALGGIALEAAAKLNLLVGDTQSTDQAI
jgi:hypothetical protein